MTNHQSAAPGSAGILPTGLDYATTRRQGCRRSQGTPTRATIRAVTFDPKSGRLATAAANMHRSHPRGEVRVWDLADGRVTFEFKHSGGWVNCLAFAPDGLSLACGSRDALILAWDVLLALGLSWFFAAPSGNARWTRKTVRSVAAIGLAGSVCLTVGFGLADRSYSAMTRRTISMRDGRIESDLAHA